MIIKIMKQLEEEARFLKRHYASTSHHGRYTRNVVFGNSRPHINGTPMTGDNTFVSLYRPIILQDMIENVRILLRACFVIKLQYQRGESITACY